MPSKPLTALQQVNKINRYALKHTEKALDYIANKIDDENASDAVRVRCAEVILDRALGKAKNTTDLNVSGQVNVQHQHLHALQDMAARRLASQDGDKAKLVYASRKDIQDATSYAKIIEHEQQDQDQDGDQSASSLGLG